jgi:hypothetical protein
MPLATPILPGSLVASGLSLLTTATALMRLAGAVAFGALWGWVGPEAAVTAFVAGLAVAIVAALRLVPGPRSEAAGRGAGGSWCSACCASSAR